MKKILAIAIVAFAAFGATSVVHADPQGNCAGAVDLACNDTKGTEDPSDDTACLVYVNLEAPAPSDANGCITV